MGNARIFYGTCDTAGGTLTKIVDCPDFTAADLVPGAVIIVVFSNTSSGTAANLKMNVNGTGAISVKSYQNASINNVGYNDYLHANMPLLFGFNGTYWVIIGYASNSTYSWTSWTGLAHGATSWIANSVVYRYQLLFHIDADTLTPLNNVSNGYNKTNKAMLTEVELDPFDEVYYYGTTTAVEAGDSVNGTYVAFVGTMDMRYTFNLTSSSATLIDNKDVYLKLTIGSNNKAKIVGSHPLVQELPSTNDGYYYMFLGRSYSTYQMCLYYHHPIYYHDGTSVKILENPKIASSGEAIESITTSEINQMWGIATIIDFYFGDANDPRHAEEGMTWREWVNTSYNTDNMVISGDNVTIDNTAILLYDGDYVRPDDEIINDTWDGTGMHTIHYSFEE